MRGRYTFGTASQSKLLLVHPELSMSARMALDYGVFDFAVTWGWRNAEQQEEAFLSGASTKRFPESKHNTLDANGQPLSDAIDFVPWCKLPDGTMGIPWEDTHAFAVIGGLLLAAGAELGYALRWGGDWDMDGRTTNQRLKDWGHVER